ncbi:beta-galactosidase GalB [Saccharophagus degradans]|uniref:beta-galactosidase GalB n=1 Tax=Saccharophagus degradans TaxID=86304 RepID=UPI002477F3E8|nr:beta-galactosidase GalB [Saccharophagus degradans]WGO99619.1 beta-galactosidase GalB [Saccharophagus degradans]
MACSRIAVWGVILAVCGALLACRSGMAPSVDRATQLENPRERVLLDTGWAFKKYQQGEVVDNLIYDVRPEVENAEDARPADAMPTEAIDIVANEQVLKAWILPTANDFIADPKHHYQRPPSNPGSEFPYVQSSFDDSAWQQVNVPHDWAIAGPFMAGWDAEVGGGMGRLPSPGVAWYRKGLDIPAEDAGKAIFLDVDGAMSYAMVWLNGQLVGGWPYGYASWRVDLTPYILPGRRNQLAIRVDNPPHSSRWYPGGGLYRNVWLTKTSKVHVAQWGTHITTPAVSAQQAQVNVSVKINNHNRSQAHVDVTTRIFELDASNNKTGVAIATLTETAVAVPAQKNVTVTANATINNPKLWGPLPTQKPQRYLAVTQIMQAGIVVDNYQTTFGIRDIAFDPERGVVVNGEPVYIQGVNQHHDLGALGAAFNVRAAERQLELLQEMGVNAIRMAHNPPAKELLDLTDKMGFLVIDEIFDSWERKKTPLDFHLIFPEWSEPDVRNFIRRDRNHPSVIGWSLGNEVGEQYTGEAGAAVAKRLHDIAKSEDPTRPTSVSINFAKPGMALPPVMDMINLNYQGEGIRNAPEYVHLKGIRTAPLYPKFREAYPNKVIISSENAAAVSSRGEYFFPVTAGASAPVADGAGGDPISAHVSAYELYTAPFGSSADKVLGSLADHPYVAGGFVWSGWDYLGEPTPYYSARSSYFGVIDLAGFKKDRFYLYQAHWRPDLPMAHILPHWNWPNRVGEVTPVHVFTSGDEAELFLNGKSLGRKIKGKNAFRIRWDNVIYQPGTLKVVAYKNGKQWAQSVVATTGSASQLQLTVDRTRIRADGKDLAFITVDVQDADATNVPTADNPLSFTLAGPGEIVATDNGDPTDLTSFTSHTRNAFNGKCLVIVRGVAGKPGALTLNVTGAGLKAAQTVITTH